MTVGQLYDFYEHTTSKKKGVLGRISLENEVHVLKSDVRPDMKLSELKKSREFNNEAEQPYLVFHVVPRRSGVYGYSNSV